MKLAALMLWILPVIAGFAAYQYYGPPHLIWSYTYQQWGDQSSYANRRYTTCTYVGWGFETRRVPPQRGKCPWVRFLGRVS